MQELAYLAFDGVSILLNRDPKAKMASVSVAGHSFMDGNYWAFKPECHGGFHYDLARLHGNWSSAEGLAEVLATFLTTEGATNVKIINETYDWAKQSLEKPEGKA
jgi:hypothetical protein